MKRFAVIGLTLMCATLAVAGEDLRPNDHICLIGNGTAEHMQHHGWLEALLHARYPDHKLVFRNLGFGGDEVAGFTESPDPNRRLRSAAFGSSDHWLSKCHADVIFAFFGYNESFAGAEGLDRFKANLARFIQHTKSQKYNGKSMV